MFLSFYRNVKQWIRHRGWTLTFRPIGPDCNPCNFYIVRIGILGGGGGGGGGAHTHIFKWNSLYIKTSKNFNLKFQSLWLKVIDVGRDGTA